VVERAIQITTQDFRIQEGLRTTERQAKLVARGASRTMHSRHLTGPAVDLVAPGTARSSESGRAIPGRGHHAGPRRRLPFAFSYLANATVEDGFDSIFFDNISASRSSP